jgi:hypothetical protein
MFPLKSWPSPFRDACGVLEGLMTADERINMPTYTVLADPRRRAHTARRMAKLAAGLPVSVW